jgi:hypothetical protein
VTAAATSQASVFVAGLSGNLSTGFLVRLAMMVQGPISQVSNLLAYRSFRPDAHPVLLASRSRAYALIVGGAQALLTGVAVLASLIGVPGVSRADSLIACVAIGAYGARTATWPLIQALRSMGSMRPIYRVRVADIVVLALSALAVLLSSRLLAAVLAVSLVIKVVQLLELMRRVAGFAHDGGAPPVVGS